MSYRFLRPRETTYSTKTSQKNTAINQLKPKDALHIIAISLCIFHYRTLSGSNLYQNFETAIWRPPRKNDLTSKTVEVIEGLHSVRPSPKQFWELTYFSSEASIWQFQSFDTNLIQIGFCNEICDITIICIFWF